MEKKEHKNLYKSFDKGVKSEKGKHIEITNKIGDIDEYIFKGENIKYHSEK